METRVCNGQDIAQVLTLVDTVFLRSKHRPGSFKERYPNLFGPDSNCTAFGCFDDNILISTATVKPFLWTCGDAPLRGAMIGLVCTDESRRKEGSCSVLLRFIQRWLYENGFLIAMLWTTIPDFYTRLGWKKTRTTFLASFQEAKRAGAIKPMTLADVNEATIEIVETLRAKSAVPRVIRSRSDYDVIPPSADRVHIACIPEPRSTNLAAIIGERGDEGFIYEVAGDYSYLSELRDLLRNWYRKIWINENREELIPAWNKMGSPLKWEIRSQAMILCLHNEERTARIKPTYFDQI